MFIGLLPIIISSYEYTFYNRTPFNLTIKVSNKSGKKWTLNLPAQDNVNRDAKNLGDSSTSCLIDDVTAIEVVNSSLSKNSFVQYNGQLVSTSNFKYTGKKQYPLPIHPTLSRCKDTDFDIIIITQELVTDPMFKTISYNAIVGIAPHIDVW